MHAELSSLTSTVAATRDRVTRLADQLSAERDADLQSALFEVERTLGSVARQLDRATRLARQGGPT
jgi:hypothetical protein